MGVVSETGLSRT